MDTGSDRSKNSTTILAALLAALLAGGIVFVWQNAKVKDQESAVAEAQLAATEAKSSVTDLQTQVDKLQTQLKDALKGGSGKPPKDGGGTNNQADPLALDDGRYPVTVEAIDYSANKLTFDLIQFYTGNAADKAAREDGVIGAGEHIENDIYSRNDSKQLRTFDVEPGAPITVVWWHKDMDPKGVKVITLAQLYNVFHGSASWQQADAGEPYWITVSGGTITQMQGQYTP